MTIKSLHEKIVPNIKNKTLDEIKDRFARADEILYLRNKHSIHLQEKVVRKTFSLPTEDVLLINKIKDTVLNNKIVLSDSEIIRLGVQVLSNMGEKELYVVSKNIKKIPSGRPKNH